MKLKIQTYQDNSIKIALLGSTIVGKSSLIYRLLKYNFSYEYNSTIEDIYKHNLSIEGNDYEIEIVDTAGEEDYQNMIDCWIRYGEGILLVFAINDRKSFESLKEKYNTIIKIKKRENCPIILVGYKLDLEDQRKVTYAEAKELADLWNIDYIETSAKTNFNCTEVFKALTQEILYMRKNDGKKCNIY